jgi:hypothetical protein
MEIFVMRTNVVSPSDFPVEYLNTRATLVTPLANNTASEVSVVLNIEGVRRFPSAAKFDLLIGSGANAERVTVIGRSGDSSFTIKRTAQKVHVAGELVRMVSVMSILCETTKALTAILPSLASGVIASSDQFSVVALDPTAQAVLVNTGVAVYGDTVYDTREDGPTLVAFEFPTAMTANHYRQALVYLNLLNGEIGVTYGTSNVSSGAVGTAADPAMAHRKLARVLTRKGAHTVAAEDITLVQTFKETELPLESGKVWDDLSTNVKDTAAATDLGLISGTFLTDAPVLQSGDAKEAVVGRKVRYSYRLPSNYVAGSPLQLSALAGMVTTVSDNTATLDVEAVRRAAPDTDICVTAAQSINSLVAAQKVFALNAADAVPGDVLDFVLTVAITDDATGTAVIGQIKKISVLSL